MIVGTSFCKESLVAGGQEHFEACCKYKGVLFDAMIGQWPPILLFISIIQKYFLFFYNYMDENFESSDEWTFT